MSTSTSDLLPSSSRRLSDAGRLLGRRLSDTRCLFSSLLAGAAGCIFMARSIFPVWVCHLRSPSGLIDEFAFLSDSLTQILGQQRDACRTVPGVADLFAESSMMLGNEGSWLRLFRKAR